MMRQYLQFFRLRVTLQSCSIGFPGFDESDSIPDGGRFIQKLVCLGVQPLDELEKQSKHLSMRTLGK